MWYYRAMAALQCEKRGGDWADATYPVLSYLTFWMSAGKWALEGIETRAQLLDSDAIFTKLI
ncbi:VacJ lipoprotein [Proteus mirabilis]|uniref:VacJ lipoprotein n=1 Tax=Proteus mirabilis TaxID=584 RepID=A0A379GFQ4_PROMI|nr:VacJ lipoprotein [Proteus mirabilis]